MDLVKYQNSSIDYIVGYKINNNWNLNVLGRTWFLPNGNIRQFAWLDINHKYIVSEAFTLKNKFRFHYAFDIDVMDPDFLRYEPEVVYTASKKFQPFIGYANFFQLNQKNYIQRARYKLGFTYKFSDALSLNFQYWNQAVYQPTYFYDNLYATTLKYFFIKKKEKPE